MPYRNRLNIYRGYVAGRFPCTLLPPPTLLLLDVPVDRLQHSRREIKKKAGGTTWIITGLFQAVTEHRSFGVSRSLVAKFFLLQIIIAPYSDIKFGNRILSVFKDVQYCAVHGNAWLKMR
jgi:hypothetical protein